MLLNNSLKWLKTVLSDEYLLIRREIPSGRFFITLYGWLEFTLMYQACCMVHFYQLVGLMLNQKKLATLRFHLHFMQFDIEEFYPSIFKDLLLKTIDYEKSFAYISNHETKTITHSRKSPLFSNTDE